MSRRRFLAMTASIAAATALPEAVVARELEAMATGDPARARAAARLTTLAQTLRAGPALNEEGYRSVVAAAGQARVTREELAKARNGRAGRRRTMLNFVHLTDQHVIDVQSPARVEFTDRFDDGPDCSLIFTSAWRPQEPANARIADAMLRRLRSIAVSPVTGAPLTAMVCTGDNTDNQQENELDVWLQLMDGGRVTPQSGDPDIYEGVQASGDEAYWHPDPSVDDRYKRVFGFPAIEGWLETALAPFDAQGAGMPWFSCYGNHDGLVQGNANPNPVFEGIAVGPVKVIGAPPGTSPCNIGDGLAVLPSPVAPSIPVTPDPERRFLDRREWMARHFESPGAPRGHGFSQESIDQNVAYYAYDVGPLRWLVLDTVNPGGLPDGSVGAQQLAWIDAELTAADEAGRLAMLFSHHGPRSLTNQLQAPSTDDPEGSGSDLPRHRADEVLAVVSQHPSVIAWVNGHTHENIITPRETFWDIGTAAHIDWPAQSRLVEVVDNRDGTLSIFTTLVDHEDDPVASRAREIMGNDPQAGFDTGNGRDEDRNAELLLPHPFAGRRGGGSDGDGDGGSGGGGAGAGAGAPVLPATGMPQGLTIGGAMLLAGLGGLAGLRRRPQPPPPPPLD